MDSALPHNSMDSPRELWQLIRRIQAGDRQAYEELLRAHGELFRSVVRRRLPVTFRQRTTWDSQDVCQTALCDLWLKAHEATFGGEREFVAYFTALVQNRVRRVLRDGQARCRDFRRQAPDQDTMDELAAAHPRPLDAILERELAERAERLLTEREKQVCQLRRRGCSWEQVAETLQMSVEAARKRFERAEQKVRKALLESSHRS